MAETKRKSRVGIGGSKNHRDSCECNPCAAKRAKLARKKVPPPKHLLDMSDPSFIQQIAIESFPKNDYRRHVAEWARLMLDEPGLSNIDIAERLGINERTLRAHLQRSRETGFLKITDPELKLENEILPLAMERLGEHVDAGSLQAVLEVVKGLGLLKSHQAIKTQTEVTQKIAVVNIHVPEGFDMSSPNVVSTGNVIDAQIVKEPSNDQLLQQGS